MCQQVAEIVEDAYSRGHVVWCWADYVFFLEEYVEGHVDADDQVDLHVSDLALVDVTMKSLSWMYP